MANVKHGLSLNHMATKEPQIRSRAAVEKRRLARSLGVKWSDLDAVGRARFDGYARSYAIADLAKRWMDENPDALITDDGRVAHVVDIYLRSLGVTRLALDKLEEFIREELKSPEQEMRELMARSD